MIRCERATVERSGRVVVESLTLAVAAGEAVAVVGRTGAGKSSLLAAVAASHRLHAGEILVDGHSVAREPEQVRRSIGYVPDRLPGWPGVRAAEFLELFAAAAGLRGPGASAAVDRALDMAGLAADRIEPIDDLPAGHRKRLLVARALLHDPQVLVLDDPLGGLDAFERRDISRLVGDAHLIGRTVLAAVDDGDVPGCFTHVAVMDEGRLRAVGHNAPIAFGPDRRWRHAIVCRGEATRAAAVVASLAEALPEDPDRLLITIDPRRTSLAAVVATLAAAGVPIESVGFDPPWPTQLIE